MALTAEQREVALKSLILIGALNTAELREAITEPPKTTRQIDGASTLDVVVLDARRTLLRSPAFGSRSWANVAGLGYELVRTKKTGSRITLELEDSVVAALRRRTGTLSIPAGSTTRADIAARLCQEASVPAAIYRGDSERVKTVVERSPKDKEKTSSWDVLGALATDRDWRCFSDGTQVLFGPDSWLKSRKAPVVLRESTGPVDDIGFDLDVGQPASAATVVLDLARQAVSPGDPITLAGMGPADGLWLVERVTRTLTSTRGSLDLLREQASLPEPEPVETEAAGSDAGDQDFLPSSGTAKAAASPVRADGPREKLVQFALAQKGKPYVWGASGPGSFDCSGLVQAATTSIGKKLSKPAAAQRTTVMQSRGIISVEDGIRTRGALLFRIGTTGTNHVAISLGDGTTIEARGRAYGVCIAPATGRGWTSAGLWI